MNFISPIPVLAKREIYRLASRRIYWFTMILAPVLCFLFFTDLLKEGLPTRLPVALVDEDHTTASRALGRSLNAFAQTEVVMRTGNFVEARKAMQRGEVYGIFHLPANFRRDASTGKEPVISFYTNDTYLLAGSLVYKDMRLQAALANGSVQQTFLLANGADPVTLPAKLMPIIVETNPLNNPWLSYAIYLGNILLPAFLCMFVMFTTAFSINDEIKSGSAREWLQAGNHSMVLSLLGKFLPHTIIFSITGFLCLSILYGYSHFPLNSGLFPILMAIILLVVSSQAFSIFVSGIARRGRIALSICGIWGVLSFSVCGFTFPVRSMPELVQIASHLFQMRHYFLIYVDQALNGISMAYSWQPYLSLFLFAFLPLFILPWLKQFVMSPHKP